MNPTIVLIVSLFCGLTWAQDDITVSVSADGIESCTSCNGKDFQNVLSTIQQKLAELETRLNKETYTVAFTAATGGGGNSIGPFSTPTTLIYGIVKTNIGSFYNQQTGIFAAPVSGLYHFTMSYHAGGEQRSTLTLMKNNQMVVTTGDHKCAADGADNGGNAVYLQLQQGDQVFVQMAANTHVWGDDVTTTFSGSLVRQD